jgi:hypothetical protein
MNRFLIALGGALDATAREGVVTLSGPVVESEVEQLKAGVTAIHGVVMSCAHPGS